jgi:hypothetical protein
MEYWSTALEPNTSIIPVLQHSFPSLGLYAHPAGKLIKDSHDA